MLPSLVPVTPVPGRDRKISAVEHESHGRVAATAKLKANADTIGEEKRECLRMHSVVFRKRLWQCAIRLRVQCVEIEFDGALTTD